jgi:hypothetical protein
MTTRPITTRPMTTRPMTPTPTAQVLSNPIISNPIFNGEISNPVNINEATINTLRISTTESNYDDRGNIIKQASLRIGDNILLGDNQIFLNPTNRSTIEFNDPNSHIKIGDQMLTRDMLEYLNTLYSNRQQ